MEPSDGEEAGRDGPEGQTGRCPLTGDVLHDKCAVIGTWNRNSRHVARHEPRTAGERMVDSGDGERQAAFREREGEPGTRLISGIGVTTLQDGAHGAVVARHVEIPHHERGPVVLGQHLNKRTGVSAPGRVRYRPGRRGMRGQDSQRALTCVNAGMHQM